MNRWQITIRFFLKLSGKRSVCAGTTTFIGDPDFLETVSVFLQEMKSLDPLMLEEIEKCGVMIIDHGDNPSWNFSTKVFVLGKNLRLWKKDGLAAVCVYIVFRIKYGDLASRKAADWLKMHNFTEFLVDDFEENATASQRSA